MNGTLAFNLQFQPSFLNPYFAILIHFDEELKSTELDIIYSNHVKSNRVAQWLGCQIKIWHTLVQISTMPPASPIMPFLQHHTKVKMEKGELHMLVVLKMKGKTKTD